MSKQINIIVAAAKNGVIGNKQMLPWSLPQDLKRFKELTQLGTVIMGRKTWESLPFRPLKNRENIIVSRSPEYYAPGAKVCVSLQDAIVSASTDAVWIIGGAEIYAQAVKLAARLYITEINAYPEGDAFFPLEWTYDFTLEKCEHFEEAGKKHRFLTFRRS